MTVLLLALLLLAFTSCRNEAGETVQPGQGESGTPASGGETPPASDSGSSGDKAPTGDDTNSGSSVVNPIFDGGNYHVENEY